MISFYQFFNISSHCTRILLFVLAYGQMLFQIYPRASVLFLLLVFREDCAWRLDAGFEDAAGFGFGSHRLRLKTHFSQIRLHLILRNSEFIALLLAENWGIFLLIEDDFRIEFVLETFQVESVAL